MYTQAPDWRASNFAPWRPAYPSDATSRAMVYDLACPVEQLRPPTIAQSLRQPEVFGAWPGLWLLDLFLMLGACVALVNAWHNNGFFDWMVFWMLAGFGVPLQLILLISGWGVRRALVTAPDGVKAAGEVSVRSLRRAALAGDDMLAPPVAAGGADQGAALSGAEITTFRVTPPEARLQGKMLLMWGIFLPFYLVIGVGYVVLFVAMNTFTSASIPSMPPYFLLLAAIAVLPFGMNLWRFVVTFRKTRAFSVEARADGLHWRKQALPWSEVRGWYMLEMLPVTLIKPQANVVYCIMGQHTSLTWLTHPPFTRTGEPGQLLAQYVHGHSGMPLRDLTPGAVAISAEITYDWLGRRIRLLATSGGEAMWRMPLLRPSATLLAFALSMVILLGGVFLPVAQQWYFGGRLAQLEASHTAIHDPLTADQLGWTPTIDPHDENAQSFTFTSQGYQFSSKTCCDIASLAAQNMGDGLVAVTVHQQVTFDLEPVGIIFRANAQDKTALVFTVTARGLWELDHFSWSDNILTHTQSLRYEGTFGGVRQVHQGLDATNRLAVLMRGSSYSFFVNGQFVGGYTSNDLPQSGQVGVYVGGTNGPVTFSDLLIAPA